MEELVTAERLQSIPKEIRSLERRIHYLVGRKEYLMSMMKNFGDKQKEKIDEKLVEHEEEDQEQPGENSPHSFTDPSLVPLRKLKKQKIKEGKPVEAQSPDSTITNLDDLSLRPRTPRYPLQRKGDMDDFLEWAQEYERVKELNAPLENLPTQFKGCKDPASRAAVVVPDNKKMLLRVAKFVVSISYSFFDFYKGQAVTRYCTGLIISYDGVNKKARILTCNNIVCRQPDTKSNSSSKPKVHWPYVQEPIEGELLFVSGHYQIALLEISVDVHSVVPQLEIPSLGSYPNCGEEVFTLARDRDLFLKARRGTILRLQDCIMFRSHCLFVDHGLPDCGAGGAVVNRSGDVVGMAFYHESGVSAFLSISIAMSCVKMWSNFGSIARPLLEMRFKNVELLDELSGRGLTGFIVDRVGIDSTAWELGVRRGNVITFSGHCSTPLAEFEVFLLSYGLAHLRGECAEADFKLEVCDHNKDVKRNINLRVPFSDVSKELAY